MSPPSAVNPRPPAVSTSVFLKAIAGNDTLPMSSLFGARTWNFVFMKLPVSVASSAPSSPNTSWNLGDVLIRFPFTVMSTFSSPGVRTRYVDPTVMTTWVTSNVSIAPRSRAARVSSAQRRATKKEWRRAPASVRE